MMDLNARKPKDTVPPNARKPGVMSSYQSRRFGEG